MAVASIVIELRIAHAQSLKDRRQVVRSVKESLRNAFNISIAETDAVPVHQSATLQAVAVSHSRDYLTGLMEQVERAATRHANDAGAEISDVWWEFLESGAAEGDSRSGAEGG